MADDLQGANGWRNYGGSEVNEGTSHVFWVNIGVWRIVAEDDAGPLFDDGFGDFTPDMGKGEWLAHGHLKWDGCHEIRWPGYHACSIEQTREQFDYVLHVLDCARHVLRKSGTWLE